MTYDPANPEHVKRGKKEEKTRRLIIDAGFKKFMEDPAGRLWVWSFLEFCGVFRTSFDASNAKTAFNEGIRNAGLFVTADIVRICPEQYVRMLIENQPKERDQNG